MASSLFGPTQGSALMEDNIQQAKRIMNSIGPAANPQQMLQNLIRLNPQYSNLMGLVNSYNGDIRSAVIALAKQRGIDINELYQQFQKQDDRWSAYTIKSSYKED